jgi:hypothetical protein
LTIFSKHLIKGTQARASRIRARLDVKGESINVERNQEEGSREKESSGRQEKSSREEEEVTRRLGKSEF